VGVLVLAAVAGDHGGRGVADVESAGGGLVGERVAVHGGGVRVVAVALEGEGGPPVVGRHGPVLGGGGHLGCDRRSRVGRGTRCAGRPGVGVTARAYGHGGGGRRCGGRAQTVGGEGRDQQQDGRGSGTWGRHTRHLKS